MSTVAIEIHDTGLRAMDSASQALLPVDGTRTTSPGFALQVKGSTVTGHAAAQQSAVQPLNVHQRFWDPLNADGHGELAFAHLQHIWSQIRPGVSEVLFAVPAHMEAYELGLLHGMCREMHLPVKGFVATPVLATESGLYLDVLLHRTVLSLTKDEELQYTHSEPNIGLLGLQRQWSKGIQNEFVRNTRFDPMHNAESEQQLVDALPGLLDQLADSDTAPLTIGEYQVHITQGMMSEWAHGLQANLCSATRRFLEDEHASEVKHIVLSHRASALPGLDKLLEKQLNVTVQSLTGAEVLNQLLSHWPRRFELPNEGQVTYQTALVKDDGEATDL